MLMSALDVSLFAVGSISMIMGVNGIWNGRERKNQENDFSLAYRNPFSDYGKKSVKKYNISRSYVIAAKNIDDARRMLVKACGGKESNFYLCGRSAPWDEPIYYCSDELPSGHSLYTFVLKKGLRLDLCGVYRVLPFKIIGQIENGHWAVTKMNS